MPTKSIRVIERAVEVLDVIRACGGTAGVSEISKEVDLPKSTVHRILVALANTGLLRKDEAADRYSLGYKALELAFAASKQLDVISIAMPYLQSLRDEVGDTATLGLKVGQRFVDVAWASGLSALRWTPTLGEQYPLHWGALGKAILAFQSEEEIEAYLHAQPLAAATAKTTTDPVKLRDELKRIREVGYALSFGEHVESAAGVAAPIKARNGRAYAAVCITGPDSRLSQLDLANVAEAVMKASRGIELGCQFIGVDGV